MRRSVLFCLVALPFAAHAQASPRDTSVFAGASGGFIALSVADLAATAKWYEEKLGLHRVMTVGRTGRITGVVADYDRVIAALRARGIQFTSGPYPPRPTIRANAAFTDNEGNMIQVFGGYSTNSR